MIFTYSHTFMYHAHILHLLALMSPVTPFITSKAPPQPITARYSSVMPPEKYQETYGFLMFSGAIKREHRAAMT